MVLSVRILSINNMTVLEVRMYEHFHCVTFTLVENTIQQSESDMFI